MDKKSFSRLKIDGRYKAVRKNGDFIASRLHEGFWVHLYQMPNFYVEVWQVVELKTIQWIEIMDNKETLNIYLNNVDIKKDLGIK